MQDLITLITPAHVGFGAVAIAAGAAALAARKGQKTHVGAGHLFVVSMGASSALGAALGLLKPESHYITFHAGVLALTLLASGWLAARASSGVTGAAVWIVGLINLANTAALVVLGLRAQTMSDGMLFGFLAADYFFLSGMAFLAVVGDANLAFRQALSDRHRVARHLWRMCLAFFIAAGSAFTGPGANAFPESVRSTEILALPELAIITLMLCWLIRILGKWGALPSGRISERGEVRLPIDYGQP